MINKPCYSERVVSYYGFFVVEYLAYLQCGLRFFKSARQILEIVYGSAYSDIRVQLKFARNGIGNGGGKLFNGFGVDAGLGLLYEHDIGFIDIDDKILHFIGE